MVLTIIVFVFVLGLLIFVHELGHFIAAKKAGIKVEEFAFGFPPKLYSKKIGGTKYAINLIPLGGYVRLFGEDGENIKNKNSFYAKPLWSRWWVIVAGVLMNFILGWILFSIGFSIGMPVTVTNPKDIKGGQITSEVAIVEVLSGSAAANAGITKGDTILKINNQKITTPEELSNFTKQNINKTVNVVVKRYGFEKELTLTLGKDKKAPLGVSTLQTDTVKLPFWKAPYVALIEVGKIIGLIFSTLGAFFATLFTKGKVQAEGVVGPVGIWFIFQTAVKLGFAYVLQFTALITLNLAIINILPFPALDGGRLIFWVYEAVSKKRITPKIENIVHSIGFAILLVLIALITFRDIIKGV